MFLAIFDDRVEVSSTGSYPRGITPERLTRDHPSILRNPIIADTFHRTGLIERWGRGTNRVAEMCVAAGIAAPTFQEIAGSAVVTFRVNVAGGEVTGEVTRLLEVLVRGPLARKALQEALGLRHEDHFRAVYLVPALEQGLVEMTVPDKPNSRLQKYRLTAVGRVALANRL